jgi:hypothetical protein
MNTTRADIQDGVAASEADLLVVVGPSGTMKLALLGEILTVNSKTPASQKEDGV